MNVMEIATWQVAKSAAVATQVLSVQRGGVDFASAAGPRPVFR
jgi:hypothetical protein